MIEIMEFQSQLISKPTDSKNEVRFESDSVSKKLDDTEFSSFSCAELDELVVNDQTAPNNSMNGGQLDKSRVTSVTSNGQLTGRNIFNSVNVLLFSYLPLNNREIDRLKVFLESNESSGGGPIIPGSFSHDSARRSFKFKFEDPKLKKAFIDKKIHIYERFVFFASDPFETRGRKIVKNAMILKVNCVKGYNEETFNEFLLNIQTYLQNFLNNILSSTDNSIEWVERLDTIESAVYFRLTEKFDHKQMIKNIQDYQPYKDFNIQFYPVYVSEVITLDTSSIKGNRKQELERIESCLAKMSYDGYKSFATIKHRDAFMLVEFTRMEHFLSFMAEARKASSILGVKFDPLYNLDLLDSVIRDREASFLHAPIQVTG